MSNTKYWSDFGGDTCFTIKKGGQVSILIYTNLVEFGLITHETSKPCVNDGFRWLKNTGFCSESGHTMIELFILCIPFVELRQPVIHFLGADGRRFFRTLGTPFPSFDHRQQFTCKLVRGLRTGPDRSSGLAEALV